jgi:hypothetical protein
MVHRIDNAVDNQGRIFRGKEGGVDIWICVIEFHEGKELETVEQIECTYWQSDSLAVERTGSLSVFLLNRLKCIYWTSVSLCAEQTEMHLLPVCLPVEQTETHLLAVCQS